MRTGSTVAVLLIVHFTGRSAVAFALYWLHRCSTNAKAILRMSPSAASASAAVNSEKVAIGTVMFVPFSDQFANHVVGVLSNAIVGSSCYCVPVAVAVAVPVDVLVPVLVLVDVALADLLADADAEPVLVPVVEIEAELELVLVDVAVAVLVPVELALAVLVDVPVAVAVELDDAIAAPSCPSQVCQRYVVAVLETEINDNISPASANVALVSNAVFKPFSAVTTISPPSVSIRNTNRMPGLVGLASVRVSFAPTDTISQISRSLFGRMVPPLPGSAKTLAARYRS